MKQTTVNEFKDGLNLDLHPLVTPKTVLTDNLNGTFITYNGNEFCLQNDRGNKWVANLTDGYTPIGIKEHNGILYIVSVNGNATEIGTFPSPNYEKVNLEEAYSKEWRDNLNNKKYSPLHVLENHAPLTNIDLGYTTKTSVTIEIQDSYDGSVNLIIVADECKPRIINSGFSVLPDNKYKFVNRKQDVATNIYDDINKESELIRTSDILTNVDLLDVKAGGQFKGGNYTFYIKFGDGDFNQTDVVAESGIVSVFNGNDGVPSTISGTLLDERTDKMINLRITGLNSVYSKIYVYYSREYSDTQGYRMTEYGMFNEPINIEVTDINASGQSYQDVWLTGFEQTVPIEPELLNVDYHTIDWARAEAQHSNMLFLGNVGNKETFDLYHRLENYTQTPENVITSIGLGSLKETSDHSSDDLFSEKNYYSTQNIYYTLGYWPNEWYRFGIVYVLDDGSTTPVFNMCGGVFNYDALHSRGTLIVNNKKGVFKTPDEDSILLTKWPMFFKFTLNNIDKLDERVKGWFIVRQKRIPTTICQGLSIGTDRRSYLPVIPYNDKWYIESFLSVDRSKEKGEEWVHKGGEATIYQKEGAPHILRPFLQSISSISSAYTSDFIVHIPSGNYGYSFSYDSNNPKTTYQEVVEFVKSSISSNYGSTIELSFINDNGLKEYIETHPDSWTVNCPLLVVKFEKINGKFVARENGESILYFISHKDHVEYPPNAIAGENGTFYLDVNDEINVTDTLISKDRYRYIKELDTHILKNALISLDPCVNSGIGSMFDGSEFTLQKEYDMYCEHSDDVTFNYVIDAVNRKKYDSSKVAFVKEFTKSKVIDENNIFSNIAGTGTSAGDFEPTQSTFGVMTNCYERFMASDIRIYERDWRVNEDYGTSDYHGYNSTHNINLIRGLFTPFLGLNTQIDLGLYSIRLKDIGDKNAQVVREQDSSEYYCVSPRFEIKANKECTVYRGDCYICTVGMRILRNFIDNTAPVTNTIVDPLTWERWVRQRSLYGGDDKTRENGGNDSDSFAAIVDYSEVNLSDLNAVDLGYWVTFPCLSSYNLGLRAVDSFHTDEMALLGSPRSFYPLSGASAVNKVGDSYLLNDGLSATVGRKRYNIIPDIPYSKSEFSNRIMFSNVNVTDAFTNGYRTFQGLAYKDYDKQYGAITKLISLGQNIFVVMEHGLGLVPVNPKALMQTTTGETIHIYGYGVLPDEMTIISQDYGSKYEHSVIRTPIGIYGMDVDAKKIWRFSDKQGFETISDMKIESYLNDYLKETPIEIGIEDVRAHYNGKKGDVMFTFYTNNKSIPESDYFNITQRTITLNLGETKSIVCYTNMDDSSIEFTNSDNVSCNYINKVLNVTGLVEGSGYIIINGINLTVTVKDQSEIIPEPEDTIPTLLLDHPSARLMLGQSCTLTPITNSSSDIIWTCDNLNIASVDNNGKITAGTVVGSAKITASLSDNPSVTATCSVITQSTPVSVIGVSLRPINIYFNGINKTKKLTTIFSPWTATNQNVEWSVSVGGNCTVDQNGVVTGLRHDRTGSVIVRTEDGGYMKSCSVVIDDSIIPVTGVQFNKSFLIMHVGEQAELNYTLIPSNATVQNVVWDSMYSSVVKVENGILTAQSSGISKIDIITKDGGFVATCLVAVI